MLTTIQAEATTADFLGREQRTMVTDFDPRNLETIDVHIGRRIRSRRRILGLNQSDVARRIGVTFQQVHKYETGQSAVTAARLYAIATALGVTFDYFYDDMPV